MLLTIKNVTHNEVTIGGGVSIPAGGTVSVGMSDEVYNGEVAAHQDKQWSVYQTILALENAGIISVSTSGGEALADGSVTTTKIAANAVTTAKIAANAVTNAQIANTTIGTGQIADGAVTTAKIAANAVTEAQMAAASIGTAELKDANVTSGKLASGAVTAAAVAANAIVAPGIKMASVAVTVAASATTGSSSADSTLVGATILGFYPTTNQDQRVKSVVLNADGSITITLLAAATADNVFNVVCVKAS